MTRDTVLVPVDRATGEIINCDGTVGGKVVPIEPSDDMVDSGFNSGSEGDGMWEYADPRTTYKAMLAVSKVDLTGAVIKLPEPRGHDDHNPWTNHGFDLCLHRIKAQMPKGKE